MVQERLKYPAVQRTTMDEPEIPEECLNDNHDFDQGGRCRRCGTPRASTARGWEERRSGGAGSLTAPLTNGEYREKMRKLEQMAGE